MDFDLSEEQQELRASVRKALERECPVSAARDRVETGREGEQPWSAARELGWTAITVPERFGGLGLGFVELALVVEEHGRALAPGPFLATVTQFLPVVLEAGSDAQRDRFARTVAAGRGTGALAVAGPTGELADDSLRAHRDGEGWRLEGARHFVLDGGAADEVAVAARVADGDGCALFVLPRGAATARPLQSLDATRPLASLEFDGTPVMPERVLGAPGQSSGALERALECAAVALAIEMVGCCQAIFDRALEHARERRQFDRPIGSFQALQHKFADMLIALEKARSLAYLAGMTIAEDDGRRAIAASMAKASAGDCARRVAKEGIQIHGGTGYTWENDIHLFVKRAKTGEALLGTARDHRDRVASLLEL